MWYDLWEFDFGCDFLKFNDIVLSLEKAGVDSPKYDAQILLEHFCSVRPHELPFIGEKDFGSAELADAVKKRADRYPLQYIIGSWSFMTEEYEVNEDCLIPRSDTELLVETAIKMLPERASFIDLCTGSGCVAISTLAARRDCRATAVDLFPKTLDLAKRNAQKNKVADRFSPILADVLAAPSEEIISRAPFGAILSNPPYIQSHVVKALSPEVKFEPEAALDGGSDGLDFYRAILKFYTPLLSPDGFFAFEIGYDQGQGLQHLASKHGFCCEILSDLSSNDRVAVLKKSYGGTL